MKKLINPLLEKFNFEKRNDEIFKQLPESDDKRKFNIPLKYKNHLHGAATILGITTAVLVGSFALEYSQTGQNNLFSTKAYAIVVDGKEIGKVRDASELESTLQKIEGDLEKGEKRDLVIENDFETVVSAAKDREITPVEDLYTVLKSNVNYATLGYSIKINGKDAGAVESEAEAKKVIEDVKAAYSKKYDPKSIVEIKILENIEIAQAKVNSSEIKTAEEIKNYIIEGTSENQKYTVVEGDTYWTIAEKHNMKLDELISANPSADSENIQIGEELNLVVPKPLANVQIKRKVSQEEKIKFETKYEYVSYMFNDEKTVKQEGEYGTSQIDAVVTEKNGVQIAKEVLKEQVIKGPQTEIIITGTKDPPPKKGTGYFINPLPGSGISSRFGSRSGGFHLGQDMTSPTGTPIKAADGGTVTFAGYSGSYGYVVDIDHGRGFTTRYAHASALYVTTGEKVYQGEVIAAVGTTGVSTGPHLHFEVRIYGEIVNPANYINTQYN